MTAKRFIFVIDNEEYTFYDLSENGEIMNMIDTEDMLNALHEENEQLKQALLFFVDVANTECSSNWLEDMEKDCKRLFNCTYEEAKEKYGDYEGSWWEME